MSATTIQPYHGSYLMPSFAHATVADAMHPGILSCDPYATLTEISRLMATRHVHCIAVMAVTHNGGEKLAWNVITDLDVLRAGLIRGGEPTASELATSPVVSVEPTTSLREAGELMIREGVTHLIVIDSATQRPTGVLSTLDVAGVLAWGEG